MPGMLIVPDASLLHVLQGRKAREIVFSGEPTGLFAHEAVSRQSAGLERAKRYISSEAFEAVIFSGFDAASASPSSMGWLSDHAEESGSPVVIIISSSGIPGCRVADGSDDILNYLPKSK